jgi:protein Tex
MYPLAELVKIDPKSIGVGQYQHDVDQKALKQSLDETVTSCVNAVGVDLNLASPALLQHVSGLNGRTAQAIVRFRALKGSFRNRRELLEVPGLGPKSFEQAAGFLRIRNGNEALDSSAVHPESYAIVYQMAKDLGIEVAQLLRNEEAIGKIKPLAKKYSQAGQGVSIQDILEELARPARDPRPNFETFSFEETVRTIDDIKEGMVLPGIVTNVAAFGAFIDIGIHEQGLAHISQLSDSFVRDPHQVVKPGLKVMARVIGVDLARKRVSLSLKRSAST